MHNAHKHNPIKDKRLGKNPFVYGAIVTGDDFANRKKELIEIINDLTNSEKIFLISPRRYGKSSLIENALRRIRKKGFYTVYIDFYKVISLQKLLESYTREIANACESKLDRAIKFLRETIPRLRPKITVDPDGKTSIGLELVSSQKDIYTLLEDVLELPEKIAQNRKKNFVIAFDEFQEIANFDSNRLERLMRSLFQHHKYVGYVFAGSKKHLLYDMVSNRNRPFYRLGRVITINKMPRYEFSNFLKKKFLRSGFKLEADVIEKVFEFSKEIPYNAQYLCHRLWDLCRASKRIRKSDVEIALDVILTEETPIYIALWDPLTLHQRQVLYAIANSGSEGIFSKEYITSNNLGALATVQTSLRLLVKKNILDKERSIYSFTDVFFENWIKRKI